MNRCFSVVKAEGLMYVILHVDYVSVTFLLLSAYRPIYTACMPINSSWSSVLHVNILVARDWKSTCEYLPQCLLGITLHWHPLCSFGCGLWKSRYSDPGQDNMIRWRVKAALNNEPTQTSIWFRAIHVVKEMQVHMLNVHVSQAIFWHTYSTYDLWHADKIPHTSSAFLLCLWTL